jgi:heme A synthase
LAARTQRWRACGELLAESDARTADPRGPSTVIAAEILLFAALAAPLAMLLACVSRRARERMPSLLAVAPVPALAAALLVPAGATLILPEPPFRMTLTLDMPGAMLLGAAALLWIIAGASASAYLRDDPNADVLPNGGC